MRIRPLPPPLPQASLVPGETARLIARVAAVPAQSPVPDTPEARIAQAARDPLALHALLQAGSTRLPVDAPLGQVDKGARAQVAAAFLTTARRVYDEQTAEAGSPRGEAVRVVQNLRHTAPSTTVILPTPPEPPQPFSPSEDDRRSAIAADKPGFPPFSAFRDMAGFLGPGKPGRSAVPGLTLAAGLATALALWLLI